MARALIARLDRQPAAVVPHHQLDAVLIESQQDVDPQRAGMLQRVGERLETDAQQVVLVEGVEAPRRSFHGHPCRDSGRSCRLLDQVGERAGEIAAFERLRAEIHDRPPRFLLTVLKHPARHVQRLPRVFGRRRQAAADRFQLQRDARESLLERVVKLARHAAAFGQHRLVLLPPASRCRAHPERRTGCAERHDGDHHAGVPKRPPWRRLEHLDVAAGPQKEPERRRRSPLVRVNAGDFHDRPGTKLFQRLCGGLRLERRREDALADAQHQRPLRRRPQHAEEMRLHPHQRRVVVRAQDVGVAHAHRRRLRRRPRHPEHGVGQDRLAGRHRREPGDVHDGARLDPLRLLGLDPRPARPVVDVEDVADVAERGGRREIADVDGMAGNIAGDDAADADPPVHFPGRRVVVNAARRARDQRGGIGRRLEHDDVAGVADEQRHSTKLLGAAEQRADVAAQPDAGVDEPIEVLCAEVPERGAHDPFLDGHVHEERTDPRIGRTPGALHDAGDLHVVAVVPAAQHRAEGDRLGAGQRRLGQSADDSGNDVRGKPAAHRAALDFNEVAALQLAPRRSRVRVGRGHEELSEPAVVDDQVDVCLFVDVRDDAADADPIPARTLVL